MAVEKERVKARFREKFKTVALSTQRLDAIADKLAPKISDDAEDGVIDSELDFLNDLYPFIEIQKSDDRAVNDKKKQTQNNQNNNSDSNNQQQNQQNQQDQQQTDDMPAWAKTLLDKVGKLETEKQQSSILQQAKEKLKDVPEVLWKRATLPEKPEDLDAWAEEIKADYTALKQETANASAGNGKPPVGSGVNKNKPTEKEVDAILDKIM